jgi:metallo-beta-lactamase family protein
VAKVKWHFNGGIRTVTGSCHILQVGDKKLLVDLGLFQGRRKEANRINRELTFNPADIDCAMVGHAHIDHTGNVPSMVRQGYAGQIYATHATRDLAALMLKDSAYIQMRDAEYVNKRERRRGKDRIEALYDENDVVATLELICSHGYRKPFHPIPGVEATFYPAGHILGSALTRFRVDTGAGTLTIGYIVDLGRQNKPILKDPVQFDDLDIMVIESTYGNRDHEDHEGALDRLARVINDTCQRGGKIIIPAFALGRTQQLVRSIAQLQDEKRAPRIPVYVDSPLAVNVTGVFAAHPEEFDRETYRSLVEGGDPLGMEHVTFVSSVSGSKALNQRKEPCIIISSSGMCEAGRILHHLRNNIGDPKNTIAIVGYQAQGTLGQRLVQQHEEVKIFGETFKRRAQVEKLNAYSAHAGRSDLLRYVEQGGTKLRKVFLVHGEPEQQEALHTELKEKGYTGVHCPETGDVVDLQ